MEGECRLGKEHAGDSDEQVGGGELPIGASAIHRERGKVPASRPYEEGSADVIAAVDKGEGGADEPEKVACERRAECDSEPKVTGEQDAEE